MLYCIEINPGYEEGVVEYPEVLASSMDEALDFARIMYDDDDNLRSCDIHITESIAHLIPTGWQWSNLGGMVKVLQPYEEVIRVPGLEMRTVEIDGAVYLVKMARVFAI